MSNTKCAHEIKVKLRHKDLKRVQANRLEPIGKQDILIVLMQHLAEKDGDGDWIIKPVFMFVYQEAYDRPSMHDSDFYSKKYLYEEHHCPINFMRWSSQFSIREMNDRSDDPHGLYTVAGWTTAAKIKEEFGYEVKISEFGLPIKDGKDDDINWLDVGEWVYSNFRPDLGEDWELENEIEYGGNDEDEEKPQVLQLNDVTPKTDVAPVGDVPALRAAFPEFNLFNIKDVPHHDVIVKEVHAAINENRKLSRLAADLLDDIGKQDASYVYGIIVDDMRLDNISGKPFNTPVSFALRVSPGKEPDGKGGYKYGVQMAVEVTTCHGDTHAISLAKASLINERLQKVFN